MQERFIYFQALKKKQYPITAIAFSDCYKPILSYLFFCIGLSTQTRLPIFGLIQKTRQKSAQPKPLHTNHLKQILILIRRYWKYT